MSESFRLLVASERNSRERNRGANIQEIEGDKSFRRRGFRDFGLHEMTIGATTIHRQGSARTLTRIGIRGGALCATARVGEWLLVSARWERDEAAPPRWQRQQQAANQAEQFHDPAVHCPSRDTAIIRRLRPILQVASYFSTPTTHSGYEILSAGLALRRLLIPAGRIEPILTAPTVG